MHKVLVTPSKFGEHSKGAIMALEKAGYVPVSNPYGRRLTKTEIMALLRKEKPIGLIAGLEPLDKEVLEYGGESIKVISRVGVGWDNIDHVVARKKGIQVLRTEGVLTQSVAEMTLALLFSIARKIPLQDRQIRKGIWKKETGFLVSGKMVGIVGFGNIGQEVSKLLKALGCKIQIYDPYRNKNIQLPEAFTEATSLAHIFSKADIITLHLPLNNSTRGIVDRDILMNSKRGLTLVNTSRAEVVDELALEEALDAGVLGGAALDVFHEEPYTGLLCSKDNVVLTAHTSSYARETRIQMERDAVQNFLHAVRETPCS